MTVEESQLARLYAVADDGDYEVLDRLGAAAGITWQCPTDDRWTNDVGEDCSDCGLRWLWCVEDAHGEPCPASCAACKDEGHTKTMDVLTVLKEWPSVTAEHLMEMSQ